jgi:hypothetical protein
VLAGDCGGVASALRGGYQRRATNLHQVIDLVSRVVGRPAQGAEQDVAELVDTEVEDVGSQELVAVCGKDRSGLLDLSFLLGVKPLHHGHGHTRTRALRR